MRRENISNDAKQKIKQLLLREMEPLKILSIGQEGVESGGPMKELFSICD